MHSELAPTGTRLGRSIEGSYSLPRSRQAELEACSGSGKNTSATGIRVAFGLRSRRPSGASRTCLSTDFLPLQGAILASRSGARLRRGRQGTNLVAIEEVDRTSGMGVRIRSLACCRDGSGRKMLAGRVSCAAEDRAGFQAGGRKPRCGCRIPLPWWSGHRHDLRLSRLLVEAARQFAHRLLGARPRSPGTSRSRRWMLRPRSLCRIFSCRSGLPASVVFVVPPCGDRTRG